MTGLSRREAVLASGAAAVSGLLPATVFAQDRDAEILRHVSPSLREGARQALANRSSMPEWTAQILPPARKAMAQMDPMPLALPAWEKVEIEGPDSTRLTLYVINKSPGASKPAILHTHGGGYILGTAKQDIRLLQGIARRLDCVIVTVEYRLAPETTWRGSVEDNYAGLKWLHANAAMLGADRDRIAVMGESAGGGHAALLAQVATDRGEVPLMYQALVYPMLDDRTGTGQAPPFPVGELIWTAKSNRFGWQSFLGMDPGTDAVPTQAVPARRADVSGLPPAWIGVGAIDLFVSEDIDYAQRMMDASIPVQLLVMPGAFHGFQIMVPEAEVSRQFTESMLSALARAFKVNLEPV